MKTYNITSYQSLLLNVPGSSKNYTIDMSIRINCHLDNKILLEAANKEIQRNEGLRLHVFKKWFKFKNEFVDLYTINEVKQFDYKGKSEAEVKAGIDSLCKEAMDIAKVKYPFEFYQFVTDDCDYLLIRVLHSNMDSYAVILTLTDILKVYFSIVNNTPLTDELTSVEEYIAKAEKDFDSIKDREKKDNEFFINKHKKLGEPTYLGCEGGFDGSKKRFPFKLNKNHPCAYYEDTIDKQLTDTCLKYCKDRNINMSSLFLSILEIYYSAVNNKLNDITLMFTSNFRGKLSEKKLPLTSSSAINFRRLIDIKQNLNDFINDCNNEFIEDLKHWHMNIVDIMTYLIKLDLRHFNGRYDQIVLTMLPVEFSGLPEEVDIQPYWPHAKEAGDNIIYFVLIFNKNGSMNLVYRYMTDVLQEESLIKLSDGIKKIIPYLNNPNIVVEDLMDEIVKEI